MTEQALRELLASMTVEEKLGEMWQVMNRVYDKNGVLTGEDLREKYTPQEVYSSGSTLNLFDPDILWNAQEEHIRENPHHIPMLFMADIIHGYATIFPDPLAQSCSFNLDLIRRANRVSAIESTVSGTDLTFFPMIDISHDPRWGRVVESAGEDPFLAAEICRAIVEGLQGDGLDTEYSMASCIKHFAAYGAVEGGYDYNSSEVPERTMRETYLKSYKGGVDAGAAMIMTSFNANDHIPSTLNRWLLRDVLRDEWGFTGVVISDMCTPLYAHIHNHVGESLQDTAEMAVKAGTDIEMVSNTYMKNLPNSVRQGRLDEKLLDEAVWRILSLKNKLGLFENPHRYFDPEKAKKLLLCDEHLAVAKQLATESCVLLKNEHHALPLDPHRGSIAVIGPFIDSLDVKGSWVHTKYREANTVTLRKELTRRYPDADWRFAAGCAVLGAEDIHDGTPPVLRDYCDDATREATIAEAERLAAEADRVILTLGEASPMFGENRSRDNIGLPAVQEELYRRVRAVNPHVTVLLYNGRPLDLTVLEDAEAILDVWYLGTKMYEAVVDLLVGDASPSGKLTMSFPKSVSQIPLYYNWLCTSNHSKRSHHEERIDRAPGARYPFGYGLSYTTFAYGKPTLSADTVKRGETLTVTAAVSNTGTVDALETVQMYIQDVKATVMRPAKELRGFQKVFIHAGETATVTFTVEEELLKYWNMDMHYAADAGEFRVYIAPNSDVTEDNAATFRMVE